MKKVITFNYKPLKPTLTIDGKNPELEYLDLREILPLSGVAHQEVIVKNFRRIPSELLFLLGNQYVRGAKITFDLPKVGFQKSYVNAKPYRQLAYSWVTLDVTKLPQSVAKYKYTYTSQRTGNQISTTCLEQLQRLKSLNSLPNHLWQALDSYSAERLERFRRYCENGKFYYEHAFDWYKELTKDTLKLDLEIYCDNPKVYIESKAESRFENQCKANTLKEGLRTLTPEELEFLHKFAPAYGIEIPKFRWRTNTHDYGKHGYTAEPEVVSASTLYDSRQNYDRDAKKRPNLPKDVRYGLRVKESDNDKLLRDAYTQLLWVIKHLKDDGLVPGYKRCPVCHEIYREHEGCECGACPGIELIPADNLFYSNAESYEDWDSTGAFIDDVLA